MNLEIEEIISKAYKNGKKISIEDINSMNLTEEEYNALMEILTSKNIKIEDIDEMAYENEINENSFNDIKKTFLDEISRYPLLTKEEERNLFILYNQGDEAAREKLIECNLKLVVSIANRFNIKEYPSIDFMDLVQEGTEGLMIAIEKYDVTKDYKFSTYAVWWIRQTIGRFIGNNGATIREPIHMHEKKAKINRYKVNFYTQNGYDPEISVIAKDLGYEIEEVENLMKRKYTMVSFDAPITEDDDSTLHNIISDEENLEETAIDEMFFESIWEIAKDYLNDREYEILLCKMGKKIGNWGSEKPLTLEEIGKKLGVTRERIRQILDKTLRKLKIKLKQYDTTKSKKGKKGDFNYGYRRFNS